MRSGHRATAPAVLPGKSPPHVDRQIGITWPSSPPKAVASGANSGDPRGSCRAHPRTNRSEERVGHAQWAAPAQSIAGLMRRGSECPRRGCDEGGGDLVGDPGRRNNRGDAELGIELKCNPGPAVGAQQPSARELLVGRMVRHPRECHGARRLDRDREKKLELLDERPPGDMDLHPYALRLTPGGTLEDLDGSDDGGAPVGVAIDRGEEGEALLEGCPYVRCRFSMKLSCMHSRPIA